MREVKLEQLPESVGQLVNGAGHDRLVITRAGQPVAIVTPVDDLDAEDLGYIESPEFWKMISERRKQKRVPLSEAFRRLEQREADETERK